MALVTIPGFIGPTNILLSPNADAEDTINFYEESTPPGLGKVQTWLPATPGLAVWQILDDSPVRCLFEQDGRAWAVAGTSVYEIFEDATAIFRGTVAAGVLLPVTIVSNGSAGGQNLIVSGGIRYVYDLAANTVTPVSDALPDLAVMGEFMDGYGFVNIYQTRRWYFSALEDFSTWDALDVNERSIASDNIVAMIRLLRTLYFLGSKTSEVWYDSGDADTPFQPIQDGFFQVGCDLAAQHTAQRVNDEIFWVGRNSTGAAMVWRASGFQPQRASTHAVELILQRYGVAGARAWTYQEDGHLFYVLVLPDAPWAVVYDTTTQRWHKRATWRITDGTWQPPRGQCHTYAFNLHLVGDRSSGAIYRQSLDLYDEEIVTEV